MARTVTGETRVELGPEPRERKINGDEEFSNRSKSPIFEEENTGNPPLAFRYGI